ncbi:MAG: hypothetical protein WC241_04065 [Candidatus Paceibacterota bacterium]|jgi:hypothetical protein
MDKKALKAVVNEYPLLCAEGWGLADPFGDRAALSNEEMCREFNRSQNTLLNDVEGFREACRWWKGRKQTKTIESKRSPNSFSLKYLAQRQMRIHPSHGAFIAAAIYCGFQVKAISGSPNVLVNLSSRSLPGR